MSSLPPSMTGPPIAAYMAPGLCQFGESLLPAPLLKRWPVSPTSHVLRFKLPDETKPLGLSTCACILANTEINGESVTRPYTPINTNKQAGSFDLLIKDYGDKGTMSKFLCQDLKVGGSVSFEHIPFNVKTQAPFKYKRIAMLVGGTGITPMVQALHMILDSKDTTEKPVVTMLYGSQASTDILGSQLLRQWAEDYPDHFKLVEVLSHEPKDTDWRGKRGFIDRALVEELLPEPTDSDFQVWICGPPPMYAALTGPRDEPDSVKGLLGEMGYTPGQVYKF